MKALIHYTTDTIPERIEEIKNIDDLLSIVKKEGYPMIFDVYTEWERYPDVNIDIEIFNDYK